MCSDPQVLRPCTESDARRITEIYNYFVRETVVTFEEAPVDEAEMAGRIRDVSASHPWLVSEQNGIVVGYAYAAPWHKRCAYRASVESTIYIDREHCGHGIGTRLYRALLAELAARRIHFVVGAIALPNPASVALHEKLGFTKVGHFREVGRKFGAWVDVGYWQLLIEPTESSDATKPETSERA